jgi:threonine aldolase
VLSITQSTEMGTVYDASKLDRVHETVRRFQLHLHMDGARFANAVASLDLPPKELTWKRGVDVLCFGGTKNGMAVGDCVVFFNRDLADEFAYRCKQAGQLASKMRFLAAPWAEFLRGGTWLDNARHANAMAAELADSLSQIPGTEIVAPVQANAVFVNFPAGVASGLRDMGWIFYDFIGIGKSRLMCSWATETDHIARLADDVSRLTRQVAGV